MAAYYTHRPCIGFARQPAAVVSNQSKNHALQTRSLAGLQGGATRHASLTNVRSPEVQEPGPTLEEGFPSFLMEKIGFHGDLVSFENHRDEGHTLGFRKPIAPSGNAVDQTVAPCHLVAAEPSTRSQCKINKMSGPSSFTDFRVNDWV